MATARVALLAPVPLEHLRDGLAVCSAEGKVAFGSRAWQLFRRLDELRAALPVDVYIYASHDLVSDRFAVTWAARYVGHVDGEGGAHPDGMRFRPTKRRKYLIDYTQDLEWLRLTSEKAQLFVGYGIYADPTLREPSLECARVWRGMIQRDWFKA